MSAIDSLGTSYSASEENESEDERLFHELTLGPDFVLRCGHSSKKTTVTKRGNAMKHPVSSPSAYLMILVSGAPKCSDYEGTCAIQEIEQTKGLSLSRNI